jgi:hypothetical protein
MLTNVRTMLRPTQRKNFSRHLWAQVAGDWLLILPHRMPTGWTTVSWPSRMQLKTYVEVCPATLASISTLTWYSFELRCPWLDASCDTTRLRSILSAATAGSLAAAAVMHARSSTESSCAKAQVGQRVSHTIKYRMKGDVALRIKTVTNYTTPNRAAISVPNDAADTRLITHMPRWG